MKTKILANFEICISVPLSWELIKMFLPPLTSLNYVHVSKQKAIYIFGNGVEMWVLEEKKRSFL